MNMKSKKRTKDKVSKNYDLFIKNYWQKQLTVIK